MANDTAGFCVVPSVVINPTMRFYRGMQTVTYTIVNGSYVQTAQTDLQNKVTIYPSEFSYLLLVFCLGNMLIRSDLVQECYAKRMQFSRPGLVLYVSVYWNCNRFRIKQKKEEVAF